MVGDQPEAAAAELAGEAAELVGEALIELDIVAGMLPVSPAGAESAAKRLDRLSEDLADAAKLVRQAAARS